MSEAVDRILGGGGHPSCTFVEKGRTWEGVILDEREVQAREFGTKELKVWKDGSPMLIARFDIQTTERDPAIEDDDGVRSLYVDKRRMAEAIAEAFRAAGVKRGDSVAGGTIKVQYVGDGPAPGAGLTGPKLFRAKFTPGSKATAVVMDDAPEYGEEPF